MAGSHRLRRENRKWGRGKVPVQTKKLFKQDEIEEGKKNQPEKKGNFRA